jgi:hypothetical protein
MDGAERYDMSWQYVLHVAYLQGRIRAMINDRFLTDYSSVWRGLPKDETGLRDGNVSQAYYEAYLKSMKQEGDNPQQGQYNLENSGLTCFKDPDTGHATFQGANGSMIVHKDDFAKMIQFLQGTQPPDTEQPPGNPPNQLEAASSSLTPQLKRQMKRNLKEMERWARASSKAFPISK